MASIGRQHEDQVQKLSVATEFWYLRMSKTKLVGGLENVLFFHIFAIYLVETTNQQRLVGTFGFNFLNGGVSVLGRTVAALRSLESAGRKNTGAKQKMDGETCMV